MTAPTTIADLAALPYEPKHIRARRALVLQSEAAQVSVYELEPGGCVPAHTHSVSWDISLVLEGEIEATFADGGSVRVAACGVHALNLVPPGAVHEIRNPSAQGIARFLLVQSPGRGFDFRPQTSAEPD